MVKKIQDAIAQDMGERTIGAQKPAQALAEAPTRPPGAYKSHIISIRFDEGDYEALQHIAREHGTTAASLVRKAVKDIIKKGDPYSG